MLRNASTIEVEERLREILREHGKYLRNVIAQQCPKDLGIEINDIETDVQLRIWRALASEREITITTFYLFRVAATATIDAIRRVKARREEQVRMAEEKENEPAQLLPTKPNESPEKQAQRSEIGRMIQATLDRLPKDRCRAVGLYLQGYKSQEIAAAFGWSEPRARNLTHRGLQTLREQLRAEGVECEID